MLACVFTFTFYRFKSKDISMFMFFHILGYIISLGTLVAISPIYMTNFDST